MRSSLFWGFGRKVASELGFDFLDGGKTAAQFLRERFGELGLPGGDGDGWVQGCLSWRFGGVDREKRSGE
jgi:hypothetical protein